MSSNTVTINSRLETIVPFTLPDAIQFDLASDQGSIYRIQMYQPPVPMPAAGFPILYLLDGNAMFTTAAQAVALQMRRPQVTGVLPGLVIGIGYPIDGLLDGERRRHDYTPSSATRARGAEQFFDFIEHRLKPVIAGMTQVDTTRQAIFGHSLGGLFVLWSLFRRPGAFRSHTAASPSIWWDDRCILVDEKAFLETASPTTDKSRLLLTAGSLEMTPTPHPARMSADAQAMATRLSVSAGDRLDVSFVEFAGESHASVVPAAISRSVRFAW